MKNPRSPITTHVLDLTCGKPAARLSVRLERCEPDGGWEELGRSQTNADGRVEDLLEPASPLAAARYRLVFDTGPYFQGAGFYPEVAIAFEVRDPAQHYHVPLLLSPYGYSTYRGS